jgi:F-type H+-transporting ATPase subunit b
MTFEFDAAFWAAIALFIFIGVVLYYKVPGLIGKALDGRIKAIEGELAEAERLRQEAKFLLEEYEAKRQAATTEAESIVGAAREEAWRQTAVAKTSLGGLIAPPTNAVGAHIGEAQKQAGAEVRSRSADVAVEAARLLLTRQMNQKGDALIDRAIKDVGSKLN